MNKLFWYLVLFGALIAFLMGLNTGELFFNVIAISLGFLVYRYGSSVILAEYYEQRAQKQQKATEFQDALKRGQDKKENN